MSGASSIPYEEPNISLILIISSFILLLNVVNQILDRLVYCGLVGQVFVGIAWGTPGAQWLSTEFETVVVQLGYLGLVLLVFEGGLSTSFPSLKANLVLSLCVAITGIGLPIAISFALIRIADTTILQAFAAGAALCSTSLGTTFSILRASGFEETRLGVVLTSAAMMDDVVGLVLVQVVGNIGSSGSSIDRTIIIRPVAVSVGLVIVLLLFCRFAVAPITLKIQATRERWETRVQRVVFSEEAASIIQTAVLVALVAASSYAGTSNLFAAYLAGASISWWFSECKSIQQQVSGQETDPTNYGSAQSQLSQHAKDSAGENSISERPPTQVRAGSACHVYDKYYSAVVERLLKPFFFASIGLSIPISHMFNGPAVWRGLVYSILMLIGKAMTGVWLFRISPSRFRIIVSRSRSLVMKLFSRRKAKKTSEPPSIELPCSHSQATTRSPPPDGDLIAEPADSHSVPAGEVGSDMLQQRGATVSTAPKEPAPPKPASLYPGCIVGSAMVARGEIGFLIASTANSNGIFDEPSAKVTSVSRIYLVVVWAIVVCTVISPVVTGLLVKRVRRLQRIERERGEGEDPLGVWGVTQSPS